MANLVLLDAYFIYIIKILFRPEKASNGFHLYSWHSVVFGYITWVKMYPHQPGYRANQYTWDQYIFSDGRAFLYTYVSIYIVSGQHLSHIQGATQFNLDGKWYACYRD